MGLIFKLPRGIACDFEKNILYPTEFILSISVGMDKSGLVQIIKTSSAYKVMACCLSATVKPCMSGFVLIASARSSIAKANKKEDRGTPVLFPCVSGSYKTVNH